MSARGVSVALIVALLASMTQLVTPAVAAVPPLVAVHPQAVVPSASYGLTALQDIDSLPNLNSQAVSHLSSSFDRQDANTDSTVTGSGPNWVADDSVAGDKVIFTAKGSGEVDRIFFAGSWIGTASIHFYIDGSATAKSYTFSQIFSGTTAPFLAPLVVRNDDSTPVGQRSGGFVSYVPIPYAQSLKITVTPVGNPADSPARFWYQVDSRAFASDANITSWTGTENATPVATQWSNAGTDPKNTSGTTTSTSNVTIPSNGSVDVLNMAGPAEVAAIKVTVPGIPGTATTLNGESLLDNLGIRIYWNNESTPSVDAPLGAFFGIGHFGASGPLKTLMVGIDPATHAMYTYFPMPFNQNARVQLYSNTNTDTTGVTASITTKAYSGSFTTSGVFKTQYNTADLNSNDPFDFVALDAQGSGKLVGLQLSGSASSLRWEEGNHRIYVDGSRTPLLGTGTEDFFGGGGYFFWGQTSLPVIGYVGQEFGTSTTHYGSTPPSTPGASGNASMLRIMLGDAVNYRSSIKLTFQHGAGPNSTAGNFGPNQNTNDWSLAYYYSQPNPTAVQTSQITPGSAGYSASRPTATPTLTAQFEGQLDSLPVTATGRTLGDWSQLTLNVTTPNNGVILRGQFDQNVAGQAALVSINGTGVGQFYLPSANTSSRWQEQDLLLPSSLTQNSTPTVRITPLTSGWTDYRYTALSLVSGTPTPPVIPANTTFTLTNRNSDLPLAASGQAVQQVTPTATTAQRWRAVNLGGDLYALVNITSGLVLDDTNASLSPGNLLQQYAWNASDAQQWHISANSAGYLSIVSKLSNLAVDVPNASTAPNITVQQYTVNGQPSQQWRLGVQSERTLAPIETGATYAIKSTLSTQLNLDVINAAITGPAGVQEYTPNTTCSQQWQFLPQADGSYLVENICGTLALEVPTVTGGGVNTNPGTPLDVNAPNPSYTGQHWLVQRVRDGVNDNYFRFINAGTGQTMDVTNGATTPGTLIQQYPWYTSQDSAVVRSNNSQLWQLIVTDPAAGSPVINNGTYRLTPQTNTNLALDSTNASLNAGNPIQQYTANNTCSQRWIITYQRLGYYRLTNQCSGQALAIARPSAGDGAPAEQWYPNSSDAQLWKIVANGAVYTLTNKASPNALLDVANASTTPGAAIQQYHLDNTNAQKWAITPAPAQ